MFYSSVCVSLVAVFKGVFLAVVFLAVMFEGFFASVFEGVFSIDVLGVGLCEGVFLAGVFEGVFA